MEMMKAVRDVESVADIEPHRLPSPKNKKKTSSKKVASKGSKKTKPKDVDLFQVIGNPLKMSDEPTSEAGEKKKKKKEKKQNKSKKKATYASSDGSFSLSSYGSLGGSVCSSFESNEGSDSDCSGSSFEGRERYTRNKRKEEIMQEKIEMLTRISNMSRMGFTATRKWSMKDDIDDIRFECYRMTRENNSRKSVKNMQHMLITAATIVEFANSIVNPFNLKLEGFSKNLMLTVSDYDDSLEELHHKWSGKTSVGPEMTVLFTFVTSAIFHHAGNVMSTPGGGTPGGQQARASTSKGPDMSSVFGLFSNMMPKPPKSTRTTTPPVSTDKSKRRPMKGPGGAGIPFANLIPSMQVPNPTT